MKFNIMRNQLRCIISTVALVQSLSKTFDKLTACLRLRPLRPLPLSITPGDKPEILKCLEMTRKIAIVGKLQAFCSSLSENTSSTVPRRTNLSSFYQFIRCNVDTIWRERERERKLRTFIFCSRIDTRVRSNLFRNREPEKHKHRPINQTDIKNCY